MTFLVFQSHAAGRLASAHTIWIWIDGVAEGLGAIFPPRRGGGQMLENWRSPCRGIVTANGAALTV